MAEVEEMQAEIAQKLASKGFDWSEDVAEVIPAADFMHVLLEAASSIPGTLVSRSWQMDPIKT